MGDPNIPQNIDIPLPFRPLPFDSTAPDRTPEEERAFTDHWNREIARIVRAGIHGDEYRKQDKALAEKRKAEAEKARLSISGPELAATGIQPAEDALAATVKDETKGTQATVEDGTATADMDEDEEKEKEQEKTDTRDWFVRLSSTPELVMELAKHMSMKSLLALYCISKPFNNILNGHLSHALRACAKTQAPESARIFPFTLYEPLCILDPVGRPHPRDKDRVRKVPSMRWLQMVVHREKTVRDILAMLARQGHRMPAAMSLSLKKMWLVMDIATSARRVQVMHSANYFTDLDLFHVQMFIVKLDMRFNDPIDGPADDRMRKVMLGQRGLTPLCRMLKRERYTEELEIIKAAVRYDWAPPEEYAHLSVFGIPCDQVGKGHLEGWGKGHVHLYRPDELVVRESVRRELDLKNHIMGMLLWGYVDPITGLDTPATEEEMYLSDEGEKPEHPLQQDYDWLGVEPPVYEESEQLKESNDPKYAIQKMKEKAEAAEAAKAAKREREAERRMARGLGLPRKKKKKGVGLVSTMQVDIRSEEGDSQIATITTRLDRQQISGPGQDNAQPLVPESSGHRPGSQRPSPARPRPPRAPSKPPSEVAVQVAAINRRYALSQLQRLAPIPRTIVPLGGAQPPQGPGGQHLGAQVTTNQQHGLPTASQPAAPNPGILGLGRGQPSQGPANPLHVNTVGMNQNPAASFGQQASAPPTLNPATQNMNALGIGRGQPHQGPANPLHMNTVGMNQNPAASFGQQASAPPTLNPATQNMNALGIGRGQPHQGPANPLHVNTVGINQNPAASFGQQGGAPPTLNPATQNMNALGIGRGQPHQGPANLQHVNTVGAGLGQNATTSFGQQAGGQTIVHPATQNIHAAGLGQAQPSAPAPQHQAPHQVAGLGIQQHGHAPPPPPPPPLGPPAANPGHQLQVHVAPPGLHVSRLGRQMLAFQPRQSYPIAPYGQQSTMSILQQPATAATATAAPRAAVPLLGSLPVAAGSGAAMTWVFDSETGPRRID